MAAKTDNLRIIPISASIWVKNIVEIPSHLLLDITNIFLILLTWSDDVRQYGGQQIKNPKKMTDTILQISAINKQMYVLFKQLEMMII